MRKESFLYMNWKLVVGILKMGYWRFIGTTLVGIAPLTVFIAIIGKNTKSLKSGLLWGSLVSLLIFAVYVYWNRKKEEIALLSY